MLRKCYWHFSVVEKLFWVFKKKWITTENKLNMDVTLHSYHNVLVDLTSCMELAWSYSHLGLWPPLWNISWLLEATQVVWERKGQERMPQVCINGTYVTYMKTLWDFSRRHSGKSTFTTTSYSWVILSFPLLWLKYNASKKDVSSIASKYYGEPFSSLKQYTWKCQGLFLKKKKKNSFSEISLSACSKDQIWTIQKPSVPNGWTFLDT